MPTTIDNPRPRRRAALALIAGALLLLPSAVAAQDDAPASPAAMDDAAAATQADADALIAQLPAELAGAALDEESLQVILGPQLLEENPGAADQYLAASEATGVPVEAMAQVNAVYPVDDSIATFGVLRVPGADAAAVMEAIIPVALAGMGDDSTREEREAAGRPVTAITSGSLAVPDIVLYPSGDQLWIIFAASEDFVEAALTSLPE